MGKSSKFLNPQHLVLIISVLFMRACVQYLNRVVWVVDHMNPGVKIHLNIRSEQLYTDASNIWELIIYSSSCFFSVKQSILRDSQISSTIFERFMKKKNHKMDRVMVKRYAEEINLRIKLCTSWSAKLL